MKHLRFIILLVAILIAPAIQTGAAQARDIQTAVFAGGCFWCVESDFDKVPGVVETISGFTGGTVANPTYKQVSRGGTGHYEAVRIKFDADVISYRALVDVFWRTIDPLDAKGQFCDRGDAYRAAVFVLDSVQKREAETSKKAAEEALGRHFATKILAAAPFYAAEKYHQNYYKGQKRVLTRFGWIRQSSAYKKYRHACGRDARVRAVWGDAAPFASH